jgi:ribosomal-protein-alanine N-acetyltransferase
MDVRLRGYRRNTVDLDAMVALDTVCFAPEFLFDRASMLAFAEAEDALTMLAETDAGTLAGFVIVHLMQAADGLQGYVLTLDIAEAYRRLGVAGRLMDAAEAWVMQAGAAWMTLHVYVDNAAAVSFYERRGYVRQSRRRRFYGAGLDAFACAKDLREPV